MTSDRETQIIDRGLTLAVEMNLLDAASVDFHRWSARNARDGAERLFAYIEQLRVIANARPYRDPHGLAEEQVQAREWLAAQSRQNAPVAPTLYGRPALRVFAWKAAQA